MIKITLSNIYKQLTKPFHWYVHLFKGRPWYIKVLSAIASFIVFVILYLGAVDINLFGLFGRSPSMSFGMRKVSRRLWSHFAQAMSLWL